MKKIIHKIFLLWQFDEEEKWRLIYSGKNIIHRHIEVIRISAK